MLPAIASGVVTLAGGLLSGHPSGLKANEKALIDGLFSARNLVGLDAISTATQPGGALLHPTASRQYAANLAAQVRGLQAAVTTPSLADTANAVVSRALAAGQAELGTRLAAEGLSQAAAGTAAERAAMLVPSPSWTWVAVGVVAGIIVLVLLARRS